MLQLLLLRHAKAEAPTAPAADFDRPLAERGRAAAGRMAEFMAERDLLPPLIVCSTSLRTRQTLAPIVERLAGETDIRLTRRLYEASAEELLHDIRATAGTAPSMLLVGHNPGIEDLAEVLAPEGDEGALALRRQKFPTCGLAVISFETPRWDEVGPGGGRLAGFHTPRTLGA